jgi:DNA-binding MarR family transcriptional regulator
MIDDRSAPGPPRDRPARDGDGGPACAVGRARDAFAGFHHALHAGQPGCWDDLDLTMPQFKAIMALASTGGMSGRELARQFGVGPSAITAIVDKLVQRGYARREEDRADRRVTWARPTPAAVELFRQVSAGHDQQVEEILRSLSPEDLALVERALAVLKGAGDRWLASRRRSAAATPACPSTLAAPDGGADPA